MKRTPSDHCLRLDKDPGPRNVRGHSNIGFSEDVNEPVFIMAARFIKVKSEACSRLNGSIPSWRRSALVTVHMYKKQTHCLSFLRSCGPKKSQESRTLINFTSIMLSRSNCQCLSQPKSRRRRAPFQCVQLCQIEGTHDIHVLGVELQS